MNGHELITKELDRYVPARGWSSNTLGLERMVALVDVLGHPEREFRTVHVGGTAGKGSTATLCASILSAHGLRVGLHVSPYVHDIRETWQLDGSYVDTERILDALRGEVRRAAEQVEHELGAPPSYFEVKVATAFVLFAELGVDAAVIEVGLGGKLDATNVFEASFPVLTNVGLDHTEILGNTVEEIAHDKVQIVKPGSQLVTGVAQPSVIRVVERWAAATGSSIELLGRDIDVDVADGTATISGPAFDVRIPAELLGIGVHRDNQVLAIAAAAKLVPLRPAACALGLGRVHLPGRLEIVAGDDRLIIDGAHSADKMRATVDWLDDRFPDTTLVGLIAFKQGKDIESCLDLLLPKLHAVVVSSFEAALWHCADPVDVADLVGRTGFTGTVVVEPDVGRALRTAKALRTDDSALIITGSLYFAGAARRVLAESGIPFDTASY